jgi:hypothetical protein
MTGSGIGNIGGGKDDRDLRTRLESQFVNITPPSSSNHGNGQSRQIGENLAETQPTGGMSLINQLNSTLEELGINKTGEFKTSNNELKFIVNQAYLEEKGFLVVQKDLLTLNKKIQENFNLHEHILNYKVEIDPTRNVVKFKPNAEFKYAPEIVNIRNIPLTSSPTEGIFEEYSVNTLIPVLVGPPPLDYLRTISGEKTNMFSGIENNSFNALEKAAKQEDPGKVDFHLAQALNIGMLPNGEMTIINDLQVLKQLTFSPEDFKRRLGPEVIIHPNDIHRLKKAENNTAPFHTTPFTPPPIRKILELLPTAIAYYDKDPGYEGFRFTMEKDPTPLAPKELQPLLESAGLHHYIQYITQHNNLEKDGLLAQGEHQVPKNLGFLIKPDGDCILPKKILNPNLSE